jgi:hypothetical protein
MINEVDKSLGSVKLVPREGQRGLLSTNKSSFRCPSFGIDKEDLKLVTQIRKLLNDYKTPDELIHKRIEYLTSFCRKIIRAELEKYVKGK